jgi:hypothetical protein
LYDKVRHVKGKALGCTELEFGLAAPCVKRSDKIVTSIAIHKGKLHEGKRKSNPITGLDRP